MPNPFNIPDSVAAAAISAEARFSQLATQEQQYNDARSEPLEQYRRQMKYLRDYLEANPQLFEKSATITVGDVQVKRTKLRPRVVPLGKSKPHTIIARMLAHPTLRQYVKRKHDQYVIDTNRLGKCPEDALAEARLGLQPTGYSYKILPHV